jgi:hypothetical protein
MRSISRGGSVSELVLPPGGNGGAGRSLPRVANRIAGKVVDVPAKGKGAPEKKSKGPKPVAIDIPAPRFEFIRLRVVGETPLVVHRFGEKARKEMLDRQMGPKRVQNELPARNPRQEWQDSLYPVPGKPGHYGFPAVCFKKAMVRACTLVPGVKMTLAKLVFRVMGDILPINQKPQMHEGVVRLSDGTPFVRFRGMYPAGWTMDVVVRYLASVTSAEQVANLLHLAGQTGGIGENRPEKSGNDWGMFRVASVAEMRG